MPTAAELLLRIRADDPSARCCLGNKYGCDPAHAAQLLQAAADLRLRVTGVSFHVVRSQYAHHQPVLS